jgi:VanZ family protein
VLSELYFWSTPLSVGLVIAVALVTSGVLVAISHDRGTARRTILQRLEWVWLAASVGVVAILTVQPGPEGIGSPLPALLNPLSDFGPRDALANLVLYVPVGFFAALVWRTTRRPIIWATVLALGVSLSIEFAQLILPIGRSAQIYDVVFNAAGGLVGGAIGTVVFGRVQQPDSVFDRDVRPVD